MASSTPFEFTRTTNKYFLSLGKGAIVCSFLLLIFAFLNVLTTYRLAAAGVVAPIELLFPVLVIVSSFISSAALARAAKKLRLIAVTEGNDIRLLENGLQSLKISLYSLAVMLGLLGLRYINLMDKIQK
jgi:hypothetical protein